MKPITTYNDAAGCYEINGVLVPRVTEILADLLPCWRASEWHLQRGSAVHACAAFIALGKPFTHDPQIAGQVAACERWFAEVKPDVLEVEQIVFSERWRYAGRLDLLVRLACGVAVIDFKASYTGSVGYQLCGYATAYTEQMKRDVPYGVAVQLNEDGTYQMSKIVPMKRYRSEWLALRAVYGIRERLGKTEQGESER